MLMLVRVLARSVLVLFLKHRVLVNIHVNIQAPAWQLYAHRQ